VEEFRHRWSNSAAELKTLRARWIAPVDRPPLQGAWISIRGDRIVALGQGAPADNAIDLGESLIVPGFVNAHTHLEFSALAAPLGSPGQALPDWIRRVLAWRRSSPASESAIARGLAESAAAGTTLLADIVQPAGRPALRAEPPLTVVALLELLGLGDERQRQLQMLAAEHLADPNLARGVLPGLSPHAPYSTHPELVAAAVRLAGAHPVAMHLAESREELELLASGGGPFRALLEELGVWRSDVFVLPRRPLDYLQLLAGARRALVIHGNYLADDEIRFLAARADRMSLVYCPRTHEYFRHEPYPLTALLRAGVSLSIGTDSRASNPDLSVLSELRTIHRLHPQLDPNTILELGTLAGARALGLAADHGSLTPGKLANLVVMPLPNGALSDPVAQTLSAPALTGATIVRGRLVVDGS
jgi:cytosine/adenosine deaminase-related metal-dependent hydrolase